MRSLRLKRLAIVLVIALVAALGAAVTAGAQGSKARSGLFGVVLRGPTKPVCAENESCEERAAGVTLVFSRADAEVARVRTARDGTYRIALAPGAYAVRTTQKFFGRATQPSTVRVPRGRFVRVDFSIDTGIR